MMDLVLSSGFLAFARHIGVLRAVERMSLEVDGVCGTSSGALIGAMWAAGVDSKEIQKRISAQTPLSMMSIHSRPWRGVFHMRSVIAQLREWLPPTFDGLGRPFGVGVMDSAGRARVLCSGSLPEAVAASCSIPIVFAPVCVDGAWYRDGGAVDRTGLHGWREHRGERTTLLHLVDRTGGAPTALGDIPNDVQVVRTRRSGAQFWSLGDVAGQVVEAEQSTLGELRNQG